MLKTKKKKEKRTKDICLSVLDLQIGYSRTGILYIYREQMELK